MHALAVFVLALFLGFGGVAACQAQPTVTIITQQDREFAFQVEIADTPAKRQRGLQYRQQLDSSRGMVFLFPREEEHSFWMKNTPIPLDIIFISAERKIVGIVENARPFSLDSRSVPSKSRFVLEINGGLSQRHGFKTGDRVHFQGFAPDPIGE